MNSFSLWEISHFAFVTLWSGRQCGERTLDWLATADVPPHSVLYWVDNSGGRMTAWLRTEWERWLRGRFLRMIWIDTGETYGAAPGKNFLHPGRHLHVANLYNLVFPRIFEEMVVTLEDDIVPPRDGLRPLLRLVESSARVGLATGAYRDRLNPAKICAARDQSRWEDAPLFDALPGEPFDITMTGGGFALLPNRALQQALPVRCVRDSQRGWFGWDGNLGRDLTALGFRLIVHPGVRCAHLCREVSDYEAALRLPA